MAWILAEAVQVAFGEVVKGGGDENARWVAVDASTDLQPKCRHRRKLIGRGHAPEAQFEPVFE